MSEDIVPFHLQNQPEIDQERINKKWYLQEEYLKPNIELQGEEAPAKNFGVETEDIYEAAYNGNTRELRNLIARGGCVNASGNFGKTPLHYAVESGQTPTVTFLLQHQANVNAQDGRGETPLHTAARAGHFEIVQLLLHNFATRDKRNIYDQTARDIAASKGHTDCVRELYVVDIFTGEDKTIEHHAPVDEELALVRVKLKELRLLKMGIFRARTVAKAENMRRKVLETVLGKVKSEFDSFKKNLYLPLKRDYENLEEKHDIAEIKFVARKEQLERAQKQIATAVEERHKAYLERDAAIHKEQELLKARTEDERGINFTKRRFKDDIKDLEKQKEEFRQKFRSTEEQKDKLEVVITRLKETIKNKHDELEAKMDQISSLKRENRDLEAKTSRAKESKENADQRASEYKLQCKKYENIIVELKNQQKVLKVELQKYKNQHLLGDPQYATPTPHGTHGITRSLYSSSPQAPREGSSKRQKKHKHRKHRRR